MEDPGEGPRGPGPPYLRVWVGGGGGGLGGRAPFNQGLVNPPPPPPLSEGRRLPDRRL